MAKLIKEIPELSGKEADKFGEKMLKKEIEKADNMTTSYTQKDIKKSEGRKEAVEDEIKFLEKQQQILSTFYHRAQNKSLLIEKCLDNLREKLRELKSKLTKIEEQEK